MINIEIGCGDDVPEGYFALCANVIDLFKQYRACTVREALGVALTVLAIIYERLPPDGRADMAEQVATNLETVFRAIDEEEGAGHA
jgi:hypothetical protein